MAAVTPKKDHFVATSKAFRSISEVEKTMSSFVGETTAEVIANMFKDGGKIMPSLLRVLGVGTGNGRHDIRVLTIASSALGSSKIHATIVEPNVELMAGYRSLVSPLPQALAGKVTFDWHEKTLEKFMESCPRIEQFDLIHFVASLYYMDAEQALRNCYERLVSSGAIFCTVGPEEAFFPKLSRKLKGKINLGLIHKFYTEVDLISISERNNWKYKELHKTSYDADITSCSDHSSTKGGLILDFLTHCQDFRGTADEMFYKDVMTFLEEQSITDDSGKKLIKPEITALVIYK